ncbi:alpha/beta hydrolase [Mycolicibacterium houstonense]|uniref:alpha/beta hydrolase n=1 Tax=Mycolicibacterium houstonense TaxID=146021 RepID=UPI0021F34DA2|nr:alpha/beta hydrolase [Mycolicibacterium houstonense]
MDIERAIEKDVDAQARRYAGFVPEQYRDEWVAPVSTWWSWRGREVHIARAIVPDSDIRVLVLHGAGGYSGALWPIASVAASEGVEVLAPDMPLYGYTAEPRAVAVRYDDWVELVCDLIRAECERDDRPLIVFGASMGGLLGYEAAARTGRVAHVVATCLLDPADPPARRAAARLSPVGSVGPALLRAIDPWLGRVRVPIRWLVKMTAMSGNRELARLCATDPRGGGMRVPLGFLCSWMNFAHTSPETFDAAPVTLVHPGADRWTPARLSVRFLQRIAAPTRLVMLDGCGHYPVEEPGLSQLVSALRRVRDEVRSDSVSVAQQPLDELE